MTSLETPYQVANFLAGIVSLAGIGYMLYTNKFVVHYNRFFRIIAIGLAVFAVTAPLSLVLSHVLIHLINATAAFVIAIGFYTLVRHELDNEESFESAFGADKLD
jgi:hypothetical protein